MQRPSSPTRLKEEGGTCIWEMTRREGGGRRPHPQRERKSHMWGPNALAPQGLSLAMLMHLGLVCSLLYIRGHNFWKERIPYIKEGEVLVKTRAIVTKGHTSKSL